MNRAIYFVIILLLATISVHASDIAPVSPLEGATALSTDRISVSISSGAIIQSCQVIIDGQITKTTPYGEQLRGRLLSYPLLQEEGTHTWYISCTTENGTIIESDARTYTFNQEQKSEVTVTSNGIFRGSLTHEFKFRNTASQVPVTVDQLASGDYISILLAVPPSTITKQLYLKQLTTRNNTPAMLLEDSKTRDQYWLLGGKNTSVNISRTQIIIFFKGVTQNKATVVVHSSAQEAQEEPMTEPEQPVEQPTTEPAQPTTPVEQPTVEPTPVEQPPVAEPPVKESTFKRFITWLSNIFG